MTAIARITLNAPPRNVLSTALQSDLAARVRALNAQPTHKLLVVESALDLFSVGADVNEHMGHDNVRAMLRAAHGLIEALLASPVPTLCVINGPCLGGAFELALACDIILAAEDAPCGLPEITLGCYPPAAVVLAPQKLPALLAQALLLSGERFMALELAKRGAGFEIVAGNLLRNRQSALETQFANHSRPVLEQATRLTRPGAAERFAAQIGPIEAAYLEQLLPLPDATEGPRAFLEKRPPRWA